MGNQHEECRIGIGDIGIDGRALIVVAMRGECVCGALGWEYALTKLNTRSASCASSCQTTEHHLDIKRRAPREAVAIGRAA